MTRQKYKLLKSHKNSVLRILEDAGLEPGNFTWTQQLRPRKNAMIPRLDYADGEHYFEFDVREGWYCCRFSPGYDTELTEVECPTWVAVTTALEKWINCLKKDFETPDLWAKIEKYNVSFSLALPRVPINKPIPASEAKKISENLSLLGDKIEQQFQLSAEHKEFVCSKLNYLSEAAKRQRSVDWVHTMIGVSVTIVVSLGLAPDKASELWELIKSVLSPFIHLINP